MSLIPNKRYYYRVKAITAGQESDYSNTVTVTTLPDTNYSISPSPASPPSIYKINSFSNRIVLFIQDVEPSQYIQEFKLTLSANSDYSSALYSNLTFSLLENVSYSYIDGIKYLVLSLTDLAANTVYYGKIKTSNKVSLSTDTTFQVTTDKTLKAATAIGVTNLTSITADANWNPVIGATGYRIDVSTNANFSSLIVNNVDAGNTLSYSIPVLIENTIYYYRVRAYNTTVIANNSNVVIFKSLEATATLNPLSSTLSIPTIRQVTNLNITEVEIELSGIRSDESYVYDVSTSINFASFVFENVASPVRKIKLQGLSSSTVYYFRAKVSNGTVESGYVSTLFTTLSSNNSLTPVQVLAPSVTYSTAFVLVWVKRNYANRYYVQLSTSITFATILKDYYVGDTDALVIDNLTPATSYYCRVYGLNTVNSSLVSNVVTAVTDNVLPTITLNTVSQVTDSSVTLNWTTNSMYLSYALSITKQFNNQDTDYLGEGLFNERNIGNTNTYPLNIFLEPATTYRYIVTGITAEQDKQYSMIGTFTTRNKSALISFSNDGQFLEWGDECNRLEVSTDKDFKFLLSGWTPRIIPSSPKQYNVLPLTNSEVGYYIRGYFDNNGVKGNYSNVVATYGKTPLLLPPSVKTTTAFINWKKNNSNKYRIQVKYNSGGGSYIPITGHTFPMDVGDVDNYFLTGLTANTEYSVQIQYLTGTQFTKLSLPVYFKTNRYTSPTAITLNSSLPLPSATISNVSFDRFDISIDSYDLYLIEVSKRNDFILLEKYIEVLSDAGSFTYIGEPDTNYYIRLYGVDLATNRVTLAQSLSTATQGITDPSTVLTGLPNISSVTVLNENEVTIVFNTVVGANGYVVEVSESNSFDFLDATYTAEFIDTNKALVSGLVGTKAYHVRVYAFNSSKVSGYGSVQTIDTTP